MIMPLAGVAFFIFGFALAWGNSAHGSLPPGFGALLGSAELPLNRGIGLASSGDDSGSYSIGLAGGKGFCLAGISDPTILSVFFFSMALAIAAASIPTGAMAERWAWKNFMLYGVWFVLLFSLVANWIWGGGWLAQMGTNWGWGHGAVDFAGAGVIQALGGITALAGAICIGPRLAKYIGGRARAMPGHSVPFVILGTFVLMFSWFGLHVGSAVAGSDLPLSQIVVNTALAAFCGALGAMCVLLFQSYKPDPTLLCNGFIAGLAAISAACPFVDPWAAMVIGAVAGVLVSQSIHFWDKIGVDDPVGSISMHGVSGLWGIIALGLFANGKFGVGWNGVDRNEFASSGGDGVRGWFYGDGGQLVAQLVAAAVLVIFGFVFAYLFFKLSDWLTPLRTNRDAELKGLDGAELGTLVYPDFTLKSVTLDG
jgi:Amt family ammonium transporter